MLVARRQLQGQDQSFMDEGWSSDDVASKCSRQARPGGRWCSVALPVGSQPCTPAHLAGGPAGGSPGGRAHAPQPAFHCPHQAAGAHVGPEVLPPRAAQRGHREGVNSGAAR